MSSSKPKLGKRKAPAAKGHVPVKKGPRKPRGMVKLPPGTVLTDLTKKKWRLGELVGWGGFGAIYLGKIYLTCELLVGGNVLLLVVNLIVFFIVMVYVLFCWF